MIPVLVDVTGRGGVNFTPAGFTRCINITPSLWTGTEDHGGNWGVWAAHAGPKGFCRSSVAIGDRDRDEKTQNRDQNRL